MASKDIVVKGAREHNLKNIDVVIPRDKFVVITGLSGSGKSTLAFDTIYAEGQRRYVESLSAYARQFLGVMDKPDVDSIEGLSPAISIEQKTTSKNPRSTVGTVTEIYDYLRLLFARIGTPHCPKCDQAISGQVPDAIADALFAAHAGKRMIVCAPIIRHTKGTYEKLVQDLKQEGFARVRVDKTVISTDETPKLDKYKYHDIEAVIDRLVVEDRSRIIEAIEHATKRSKGLVLFVDDDNKEHLFSTVGSCKNHPEVSFTDIQPRNFSFNSPFGACQTCHGLGVRVEFSPDLIIPDKSLSINENAVRCYATIVDGWRKQQLASVARANGFSMSTPINQLSKAQFNALMYGSNGGKIKFTYEGNDGQSSFMHQGEWEGVVPQLQRLYRQTESERRREDLQKFMVELPCDACEGRRLKPESLSVKVAGKNIIDVTESNISGAKRFLLGIKLTQQQETIAKPILKELGSRLGFLENVGLDYLTLSRSAGTLSGGEAQRIRLATQIGSNLMGVLYILDEPSIGLHQRDNQKLIDTLHHLRDLGNTLLVVEHDEDTMRASDWIIDMGPGAGVLGGRIVAQGTPQQLMKDKHSVTGQYLGRKKTIPIPKQRRKPTGHIEVQGASAHNLKNVSVKIPTGTLALITGVSGSGKSTLINQTLVPALHNRLHGTAHPVGAHKRIDAGRIDKIIVVDQSPIGRTPRSNPATYTKTFDDIRLLYASTKEAKIRGYKEGRFSFNVPGGRCEACQGDGVLKIEMNFLPDVYVECETCKGRRYNSETLQVIYKGKNISEVLQMTVDEAFEFFQDVPGLARKLSTLQEVGLGYIKLGQPSTTLSGGEAQRIKLTRELAKRGMGHTVYVLDEPTTGLHFEDIKKLLAVLNKLVDKDSTVIVIEHNLDVIKCADWIIDLGPEGGDRGGTIVTCGTPEDVARHPKSYTGQFLKKVL